MNPITFDIARAEHAARVGADDRYRSLRGQLRRRRRWRRTQGRRAGDHAGTLLVLLVIVAAVAMPLTSARSAHAHTAGPVMLGADINPTVGGLQSIGEILPFDDDVLFVADDGQHGAELWFLDTSEQSARLVRDINPDPDAPGPRQLARLGALLFFVADDGEHGAELWKSDGTEAGTGLLDDINEGPGDSHITQFVPLADRLWFTAVDQDQPLDGAHVYATAGSVFDTSSPRFADVDRVEALTTAGNHLFFAGCRATSGCELWRWSPAQFALSAYDFEPGSASSWARPLVAASGTLYFSMYVQGERRLARIVGLDAVAGPSQLDLLAVVIDATVGAAYSGSSDAAWFVATTPAHRERAVWVVPSRGSGQPIRLTTGPIEPQALTAATPTTVLFSATSPATGRELFAASTSEVEPVADIAPGPGSAHPRGFVRTPGGILTWALRDGREQLFSIGANGSVTPVPGLAPSALPGGDSAGRIVASPQGWLHGGRDAGSSALWVRVVVDAGQSSVPAPGMPAGGGQSSLPIGFAAFDGGVVSGAFDGSSGHEPWLMRPGGSGPVNLHDSSTPGRPGLTLSPTSAGQRMFFLGWHGYDEASLWAVAPGASAQELSRTRAGSDVNVSGLGALTALGDRVLFRWDSESPAAGTGAEPWVSDGTQDGTRLLADIHTGAEGSYPHALTRVGSRALFGASPAPGEYALWSTDGTPNGTNSVAALPGPVRVAVAAGGRAWLALDDGLWVSDGTAAGTRRVAFGGDPATPTLVTSVGADAGRVYAWAENGLWQVDLVSGALAELAVPAGVNPVLEQGAAISEAFVFPARTASTTELFAIRGDAVVALGVTMSVGVEAVVAHHEYVYALGSRPDAGAEVWRTDGTPAGTLPITDFSAPGATPSRAFGLTPPVVIGDRLWFSAASDGRGVEPRYIALTTDPGNPGNPGSPGNPGAPDQPGGGIVPIEPARFWDTRDSATSDGQFRNTGRVAGGTTFAVQVAGRGDVPVGAPAAAVNLTVVAPGGPGFATLYPCGVTAPKASHLNYLPGDVLANAAIVPLDPAGRVCVYTKADAGYVLDVNGYADPATPPLGIEPARYLDTRLAPDNPTFDGVAQGTGPVAARSSIRIQIAGRGAVPTEATAVIVNVTAIGPDEAGFLTVYPCTDTAPRTSTVNYAAGQIAPNGAVADLAADGTLCIFTRAQTDIVVDVAGYLSPATEGVHPAPPARLFDSRVGEPIVDGIGTGPRPGARDVVEIQVTGRGGVPDGATAAFFNVTAVGADAPGYVTLYPCGPTRPGTSNLNYLGGTVRANNAVTKLSATGTVCAFTRAGADVVLDVTGWVG